MTLDAVDFQPQPILQSEFQDPPWSFLSGQRLPGIGPVDTTDWLRVDEAYTAQMALRDHLLAVAPDQVHAMLDTARPAALETLEVALPLLPRIGGFSMQDGEVRRPDGISVAIDRAKPLITLGRLVQEDICLLEMSGDEYILTGAVLCFPASWRLNEKLAHPMSRIHLPVSEYDDRLTRKVQRMLQGLPTGMVIRRANCLDSYDFRLFQPRSEADRRTHPGSEARYIRTERQCFLKLPKTHAIVFSIHTCVVAQDSLPASERAAVAQHLQAHQQD